MIYLRLPTNLGELHAMSTLLRIAARAENLMSLKPHRGYRMGPPSQLSTMRPVRD